MKIHSAWYKAVKINSQCKETSEEPRFQKWYLQKELTYLKFRTENEKRQKDPEACSEGNLCLKHWRLIGIYKFFKDAI